MVLALMTDVMGGTHPHSIVIYCCRLLLLVVVVVVTVMCEVVVVICCHCGCYGNAPDCNTDIRTHLHAVGVCYFMLFYVLFCVFVMLLFVFCHVCVHVHIHVHTNACYVSSSSKHNQCIYRR